MSAKVYHQVGHNSNWNVESFEKDGCGDGLILSPVHQAPSMIDRLDKKTRAASIFDPQFYVPSSQKPKLLQYDFFPESVSSSGFATIGFESLIKESAGKCLAFQRDMGFRRLVVPTRFLDQMYSNYVDRQRAFSVDAFMEQVDSQEEVCLMLALTAPMIEDEGFRTKVLSWVTSYPNIVELCINYFVPRETKQICEAGFLISCHRLGLEMRQIGLDVTWGHQNTEALLTAAQGDVAVSIGSFENTRMFSTDKFVVTDEDRRGPKARVYLKGLLNWIQFEQAKEIRSKLPGLWEKIYEPTKYSEEAFSQALEPTFNQSPLYKHYFLNMSGDVYEIGNLPLADRKSYLRQRIEVAQAAYAQIGKYIQLERHGQGAHLPHWLKAVDQF